MKLRYRITNWLWSTWIGDLYFQYLIWIDAKAQKLPRYLSPKELATIVKEHSMIYEGVAQVKRKVNALVTTRNTEEYHRVLSTVDNLIDLSANEKDEGKAILAKITHEIAVKKGNKDIVTPQDKLNMINQRIEDMKELHAHIEKRNLYRALRNASRDGNTVLAEELRKTIQEKYGKRSKQH